MGDCIDNPNKPTKNPLNLNSSTCYWRCNNGSWIIDSEIGRHKILTLLDMVEEFTSKEIWDELLRKKRCVELLNN